MHIQHHDSNDQPRLVLASITDEHGVTLDDLDAHVPC
jgi:hypothetical protein